MSFEGIRSDYAPNKIVSLKASILEPPPTYSANKGIIFIHVCMYDKVPEGQYSCEGYNNVAGYIAFSRGFYDWLSS